MPEKAIRTFEEIGRIPGRVLKYLLSDHSLDVIDDDTPFEERLRLIKREEKMICIRAALYGVLSGLGIVGATYLATPLEPDNSSELYQRALYYALVISIGVLLTMIELVFIYIDTIHTARNIAIISGIRPTIIGDDEATDELIISLMYAGLKAPNSHVPMYGIDPREYTNKAVLVFGIAAHKSKIAITRIILKVLYRRILVRVGGRTASRAVIETASIPVFAIWNFIVVKQVMKEIRIRTTVPILLDDLVNEIYPNGFDALTITQQKACMLAIKSQVTGVADFHPNVNMFFEKIMGSELDENAKIIGDDFTRLEDILSSMNEVDRKVVLHTFGIVCGIDGRIKRRIRAESKRIALICPEYDPASIIDWKKYFLHGGKMPK